MERDREEAGPPEGVHEARGEQGGEHRTEPVNLPRVVGSTLDGLVRSCRMASPSVLQIASRLLERWRQVPDCVLRLEPTALHAGGDVVLVAEDDGGRWLLPAFMAGMKSLRPGADAVPEDLVRLAKELAALGPSLPSMTRFRDWLWAEGAEGFEVMVDHGFVDGLDESMTAPVQQRAALEAIRAEASTALGMMAGRIASRDLDAAAARDEFSVPLETFAQAIEDGLVALSSEESAGLVGECEDPLFWLGAQVNLAFEHPELQTQLPPERLARGALALVRGGAAGRFLNFVIELRRRREGYAARLLDVLETAEAGKTLGMHIPLESGYIDLLAGLFVASATPFTRALAGGLLERCTGAQEGLRWLARLMATAGFEAFWGKVDASALSEKCAGVMCRLLVASRAPLPPLADLLARVPPATGVRLAVQLPPAVLFRLKQPVLRILSGAVPKDADALLTTLAHHAEHDWGLILGEQLLASHGAEWPLPVVRSAFAVVAARGHAAEYLLPLVHDRQVRDDVKLTALRFIERDAVALSKLGSSSLGELLLSKEVRDRLKALRRRQEETS